MPLFDRVYKLVVGQASSANARAADTRLDRANRDRAQVLLAEYRANPNMPDEEKRAKAAEMRSLRDKITNPTRTAGAGLEITELHVSFQVTKTLTKNPNNSEIRVWGMKEADRELVAKPDTLCYFYAGYSEDTGPVLLFQGNVLFSYPEFEIPEVINVFELGDGFKNIRDTTVSLSYGKDIQSQTIIKELAAKMGLGLYMAEDLENRTWANGFSFYGAARKALDKVVAGSTSQWSIQNGVLQVLKQGGSTSRRAFVLSADSGMIRTPKRMRKGSEDVARVTDLNTNRPATVRKPTAQQDGWKVSTLLMPSINPGDTVKLDSRAIKAELVVSKVTHRGDTHEGDWTSEFELVTFKAAEEIKAAEKQRQESAAKAAQRRAARANRATALNTTPAPVGTPSLPTPPIPPSAQPG